MGWIITVVILMITSAPVCASSKYLSSSAHSSRVVSRQQSALAESMKEKGFKWGAHLYVRIFKEEKSLEVWLGRHHQFGLYKSYPICTYGGKGVGPKTRQGDGRAPEGFYFVAPGQMNPFSRYHLAFNLGYPNAYDRIHGRTGSALMIHGNCVSIGCFAMTDTAMEEIYSLADAALRNGQPFFRVHIFPFRMTEKLMHQHRRSPMADFWWNLKEGYDWFSDNNLVPPDVRVARGRYWFRPASGI